VASRPPPRERSEEGEGGRPAADASEASGGKTDGDGGAERSPKPP
jgi:hypothetical protein